MRLFIAILSIFSISALASSCYYDKEDLLYGSGGNCDSTAATYSGTVAPIMNSYCATGGCHNASSAAAGVVLDNYNGVKAIASNGKLIGTVNWASGFSPMPKGGSKLPNCNITKLQQWINAGAPNN